MRCGTLRPSPAGRSRFPRCAEPCRLSQWQARCQRERATNAGGPTMSIAVRCAEIDALSIRAQPVDRLIGGHGVFVETVLAKADVQLRAREPERLSGLRLVEARVFQGLRDHLALDRLEIPGFCRSRSRRRGR